MIPLMWVAAAYGFCRMLTADSTSQIVAYGLLFCMSCAVLAFCDDI